VAGMAAGTYPCRNVDLVAFVDGTLSLREAHDVADAIEAALMQRHPEIVDVVVHLEPTDRRGPGHADGASAP